MEKRTKIILSAIFVITVLVRLILAFHIQEFTYQSYFNLRQVDNILHTGLPLYHDPLSYGGRDLIFLPFFHYFMALFSLFIPLTIVAKVIPNILVATLTITSYLIAKKITDNDTASLLAALITGFLPILFSTNSFTVETLSLPLTFLIIYSFFRIKEKKYLYTYIISFLILSVTSSAALLIIIGFIIYLLLSYLESKNINRSEVEVMIFSLFFFIWVQFIFFKNALLNEGIKFIWQNIPSKIVSTYFPKVAVGQALVLVSIIPFIAGIYMVYKSLFELKGRKSFLLISFVVSTTLFTWLRLLRFKSSLAFFGVILAILFASFYQEVDKYYKKTKFPQFKRYTLPIIIILLLISTIVPAIDASLNQDVPSREEVQAFQWIKENTPENANILATLDEGNLVTYYSDRKNIMDDQFILIDDVDIRFNDLVSLYTTQFQTQGIGLAQKYDINYIVLTPTAKEKHNIVRLNYASNHCFNLVYKNETKIYQIKCQVTETE